MTHSHPLGSKSTTSLSLGIVLASFFLFCSRQSFRTSAAPPLTLFVSTVGRSLFVETSTSSVGGPVTSTTRCLATYLTSSGVELYWRCTALR